MARIAELQPVAFSPFSRIRSTASFSSSCVGDGVRSHLRLCLYQSRVAGETLSEVFPFLDELLETRVHVPSVDLGSIEGTKPRMLLNGRDGQI